MRRAYLTVGIILLFIETSSIPLTAQGIPVPSGPFSRGNWLYVGGSGPGNYTTIQDAIDNASNGDTVFVFPGTYLGYVIINKAISLLGGDKNTTHIIGYYAYTLTLISDWVTMSGFTIQYTSSRGEGVRIDSSHNVLINNIIDTPRDRIRLSGNSNIFSNNTIKGAYLFLSGDNNTITRNSVTNTRYGIYLTDSCKNNTIANNSLFHSGVFIADDTVWNNRLMNNTVNGKPLVYMHEESDVVVDGDVGQIILIQCTNISVQNQVISDTMVGIQIWGSSYCTITGNTITGSLFGTDLHGWDNTVQDNTFWNNFFGFSLSGDRNTIINNTISNNDGNGIYLRGGDHNTIAQNVIENNNYSIMLDYDSTCNAIIQNTIAHSCYAVIGLSGSRNTSISGNTISNNEYGIYLSFSDHNIMNKNIITNNCYGILLDNGSDANTILNNTMTRNYDAVRLVSDRNTVSENTITDNNNCISILKHERNTIDRNTIAGNNGSGIYLDDSHGNTISGNSISSNTHGVFFVSSFNNTVFHNNFLRNKHHAAFVNCSNIWDGNYWGRPRIFPKLIVGTIEKNSKKILWFNADWHPAQKPFVIP
ncbi:MAG TPA: NosD domain-containing protein [Candidatus Thermoplasmatota archaeon]|nr:NosD domain-containing protein [Candidatus Thermoplasmatota archaeon]